MDISLFDFSIEAASYKQIHHISGIMFLCTDIRATPYNYSHLELLARRRADIELLDSV